MIPQRLACWEVLNLSIQLVTKLNQTIPFSLCVASRKAVFVTIRIPKRIKDWLKNAVPVALVLGCFDDKRRKEDVTSVQWLRCVGECVCLRHERTFGIKK